MSQRGGKGSKLQPAHMLLFNLDSCALLTFYWSTTFSDQYWSSLLLVSYFYMFACTFYSLAHIELQLSKASQRFGGHRATIRKQQKRSFVIVQKEAVPTFSTVFSQFCFHFRRIPQGLKNKTLNRLGWHQQQYATWACFH